MSMFDRVNDLPGPGLLMTTQSVDGKKWLAGRYGANGKPQQADVMVVGQHPTDVELNYGMVFAKPCSTILDASLSAVGLDPSKVYYTNAVKYGPPGRGKVGAKDISACMRSLLEEIIYVNPRVIVALGSIAVKALCDKSMGISSLRGTICRPERLGNLPVFVTWHPFMLLREPEKLDLFRRDLFAVTEFLNSGKEQGEPAKYQLVTTMEQLAAYLGELASAPTPPLIAIDAEWHGQRPFERKAYMRTLQMCHAPGQTRVLKFYPQATVIETKDSLTAEFPDPAVCYEGCLPIKEAMTMLRSFVDHGCATFLGHNLKADGLWLKQHGVDVRPYTVWDTMLVEHLMDNNNDLGLEELTLKYTSFGRYDYKLAQWKSTRKKIVDNLGYGAIPDELLFPYAATDVEVLLHIMQEQLKDKSSPHNVYRMLQPRGIYPSLIESTLQVCNDLYEAEETGMVVDKDRLLRLSALYKRRRDQLASIMLALISQHANRLNVEGPADFNFRSSDQVCALLFGPAQWSLGLTPVVTTGKPSKSWEWVMKQSEEVRKYYRPSTAGTTLDLLKDKHPIVQLLAQLKSLDQVVKSFIPHDEFTEDFDYGYEKGMTGVIWEDGKLHSVFLPTTDTGRCRSFQPNTQNFPKASEKEFKAIFKDCTELFTEFADVMNDGVPVSLRSGIIAPEGYIMVESDYKQAELFVLAGLANDTVMWRALTTPGMDLHDMTAIDSFGLRVILPDGNPADDNMMLELAAKDLPAFEALQKKLRYVTQDGRVMTRSEFKDGLRVGAKAVNFGIPYGRGAAAIAMQITAETGKPVAVQDIATSIEGWHKKYRSASGFLSACQQGVLNPGYVENAWGRRRYFRHEANDESTIAAQMREAGNFPIQATVADTIALAVRKCLQLRDERKMRMRWINQIHDALLFVVPAEEEQEAIAVIREGMSSIVIPLGQGRTMSLQTDVEVFPHRWGEKRKQPK